MLKLNDSLFNSNEVSELTFSELQTINGGGWGKVIAGAAISMFGIIFAVGAVVGYYTEKMK